MLFPTLRLVSMHFNNVLHESQLAVKWKMIWNNWTINSIAWLYSITVTLFYVLLSGKLQHPKLLGWATAFLMQEAAAPRFTVPFMTSIFAHCLSSGFDFLATQFVNAAQCCAWMPPPEDNLRFQLHYLTKTDSVLCKLIFTERKCASKKKQKNKINSSKLGPACFL